MTEHKASLYTLMTTPHLDQGCVYGVSGAGQLMCLDEVSGQLLWETGQATGKRPAYFATCFRVRHQDRYFLFNDQGDLILARLSREKYEELGRAHILEPTQFARGRDVVWSHPAFANRCLYARNDKELVCVSLADG